jgi:hypothetical protein
MDQPRANPWVAVAIAAMAMLVLLFAWSPWRGGATPGDAVRGAANAIPDLRPHLPPEPHLPKPPIPSPK